MRSRCGLLAGVLVVAGCAQGVAGSADDDLGDDDGLTWPDARLQGQADASADASGILPDADPGLRGWQQIALPIPTTASYASPALAIDGNGQPVVSITNGAGANLGAEAYHLVDDRWTMIGSRQAMSFAGGVDLAASAQTFFMAWPDGGGPNQVRSFTGGAWITPAGTPLGANSAYLPYTNVIVDEAGKPWVAYSEHVLPSSNEQIYVDSQSAGATWQARASGISSAINQSALAPDLVAAGGKIFMAFEGSGVFVRVYDSGSGGFAPVGTGSLVPTMPAGVSSPSTCSVGADASGHVWVAFHAYVGGDDGTLGYVARWDGAAWSYVGQGFQGFDGNAEGSATYSTMQDLAVSAAGIAYVVWTEENASTNQIGVYVDRCEVGSGCVGVGRQRLDVAPGDAVTARIAIDGANRPVVAWSEHDTTDTASEQNVYVWRYYGDPDD
jgi:hypothetical protein